MIESKPAQGSNTPNTSEKFDVNFDVIHLTSTQLQKKYKREFNSHRGMINRKNQGLCTVHKDFLTFSSFLKIMKTIPGEGFTLDRINPHDTEYSPAKCRWASKKTQANNQIEHISPFPKDSLELWESEYKKSKKIYKYSGAETREAFFYRVTKENMECYEYICKSHYGEPSSENTNRYLIWKKLHEMAKETYSKNKINTKTLDTFYKSQIKSM